MIDRMGRPRVVGYAPVSTDAQTTALQLDALASAGCDDIFEDAAIGNARDRNGLARALSAVAAGDTLIVWRLDRLGRSLSHLLEIVDELRSRGVTLRSLTESIDTSTAAGTLIYSILGSVAEFERNILRERTRAGIAAARRRGIQVGRRRALTPSQIESARVLMQQPGATVSHVARQFKVGRATLYRALSST